ncbi:MAG: hypothetical protein IPL65_17215 [Lewinellaceae bacterium]|nr:hypothetical protein [Lewinellaceae bacterium]
MVQQRHPHHHYSETKILPGCAEAYFAGLVKASDAAALPGGNAETLLAEITL